MYYGYYPDGIYCTWSGDGWFISISFYWTSYDPYFNWYLWLRNNGYTVSESCGDQALDDIIATYYQTNLYGGNEVPTCHEMSTTTHTQYFTHNELTVGNGTTWAWLRTWFVTAAGDGYGADQWRVEYGGRRTVASGYRTPQHNFEIGGANDSRHMHGDALDLNNDSRTQTEFDNMVAAAQRAGADYIEPQQQSGIKHVHADWRNHGA